MTSSNDNVEIARARLIRRARRAAAVRTADFWAVVIIWVFGLSTLLVSRGENLSTDPLDVGLVLLILSFVLIIVAIIMTHAFRKKIHSSIDFSHKIDAYLANHGYHLNKTETLNYSALRVVETGYTNGSLAAQLSTMMPKNPLIQQREHDKVMNQFAADNAMDRYQQVPYDGREGALFGTGSLNTFTELLVPRRETSIECIGNYYFAYTDKLEVTGVEFIFGYASIRLKRSLPNILFDSKANDVMCNISFIGDKFPYHAPVRLDGETEDYFNVYAHNDAHLDVFYYFGPDVLIRLIDLSKKYTLDYEFIGDRLHIYSAREFDLTNPYIYEAVYHIAQIMDEELKA